MDGIAERVDWQSAGVGTDERRGPGVAGRLPSGSPREFLAALTMEAAGEAPGFLHPVNWMGRTIWLLERLAPRSGRVRQFLYGLAVAAVVPSFFAMLAWWAQRRAYGRGPAQGLATSASLLKSAFAVRALGRAAGEVREALEQDDLDAARKALGALVSRPPAGLGPGLIASAAVESVAENTTDSFIAPWLFYIVGGVPGAFFYRAVNTLDARIGYDDERRRYLGWTSAKLDDALNFVPARLAAMLIVASALVWRRDAGRSLRTMRRDRARTASPNAGWTMGAMAGALRVRLEKRGHYRLGRGWWPRPGPKQIRSSVRMSYTVAALAAAVAYGLLTLRERIVPARYDDAR